MVFFCTCTRLSFETSRGQQILILPTTLLRCAETVMKRGECRREGENHMELLRCCAVLSRDRAVFLESRGSVRVYVWQGTDVFALERD